MVAISKTQEAANPFNLTVIGDSIGLTYGTHGNLPSHYFGHLVAKGLQAAGLGIKCSNWSLPGDTTNGMNSRLARTLAKSQSPDIALVEGGINDPGAITFTTTATYSAGATVLAINPSATQVLNENILAGYQFTVNGNTYTITYYSVQNKQITITPGLAGTVNSGSTCTIAALTGAQTTANLVSIYNQLLSAGCKYIMQLGAMMRNFAGSDSLTTQDSTSQAVRIAQAAAVAQIANPNVFYFDSLAAMRAGIGQSIKVRSPQMHISNASGAPVAYYDQNNAEVLVGASVTPGNQDGSYHIATSDQHLNPLGHQVVADAIVAQIKSLQWIQAINGAVAVNQ